MGEWNLDPLVLATAAVALGLYGYAFVRLRRRAGPQHARAAGALLVLAGTAAGTLAVVSPLDALAEETLLSAHMAQHLLIGDLAPLFIVLGLRGPIALFLLPPALLRPLARNELLRRGFAFLLRPGVALGVWTLMLAFWHVPRAYDAALAHPALHLLEHAGFFVAGLLLWNQIVDPARRRRLSEGRRAALAAAALLVGMVVSEVLLASGPLYSHYAAVGERPFGLTQATDQSRAGLLMMAEQIATFGPAAALLLWSHVERVAAELAAPPG